MKTKIVEFIGRLQDGGAETLVKDYALMVGVPAKQIGWVCECGKRLDSSLRCDCGREYILIEDCLKKK